MRNAASHPAIVLQLSFGQQLQFADFIIANNNPNQQDTGKIPLPGDKGLQILWKEDIVGIEGHHMDTRPTNHASNAQQQGIIRQGRHAISGGGIEWIRVCQ